MTGSHERRRVHEGRLLDRELETTEGRARFWERLGRPSRSDSLISLLGQALEQEGDVIECGVYRGRTLFRLARALGVILVGVEGLVRSAIRFGELFDTPSFL